MEKLGQYAINGNELQRKINEMNLDRIGIDVNRYLIERDKEYLKGDKITIETEFTTITIEIK